MDAKPDKLKRVSYDADYSSKPAGKVVNSTHPRSQNDVVEIPSDDDVVDRRHDNLEHGRLD